MTNSGTEPAAPAAHAARPCTIDGWTTLFAAHPELSTNERRALEIVYLEGITPSGIFRTFGWAADRAGLSRAGFLYRFNRARFKLGWADAPKRRPTITRRMRAAIIEQAVRKGRCGICGLAIVSTLGLELDHVVTFALGGASTPANLRAVHLLCNRTRELLEPPEHPEYSTRAAVMAKAHSAMRLRLEDPSGPVPPGFKPRSHCERRMQAVRLIHHKRHGRRRSASTRGGK